MAIETTYTELRARLATFWDRAVEDRETVIIRRRGKDSVALIALDELSGLLETAHLLRSPRNAERLLAALEQARRGEGEVMSVESLRASVGLSDDEED